MYTPARALEDVRVVLVDACPVLRSGLAGMIRAEGSQVVGEAGVDDAIRIVREASPDFVILDPDLGHEPFETVNGMLPEIDLCRKMKSLPERPFVIVYSYRNSFADIAAFVLSGVDHYVHKSTEPELLVQTGKRILAGESAWLIGVDLAESSRRMIAMMRLERLTPREKQIFSLMLRRCTNQQIAENLHASLPTVKKHVGHILRKLDCEKRGDLFGL